MGSHPEQSCDRQPRGSSQHVLFLLGTAGPLQKKSKEDCQFCSKNMSHFEQTPSECPACLRTGSRVVWALAARREATETQLHKQAKSPKHRSRYPQRSPLLTAGPACSPLALGMSGRGWDAGAMHLLLAAYHMRPETGSSRSSVSPVQ